MEGKKKSSLILKDNGSKEEKQKIKVTQGLLYQLASNRMGITHSKQPMGLTPVELVMLKHPTQKRKIQECHKFH